MYEIFSKLLEFQNLKASNVAKGTRITPSTFSDWKSGRSIPKDDKMTRIAEYLGVTVDFLKGKTNLVVCEECGFGRNPLNEYAEKEHNEYHDNFVTLKDKYPFLMNYKIATFTKEKALNEVLNGFNHNPDRVNDALFAFDLYLKAVFSLECQKTSYKEKITFEDWKFIKIEELVLDSTNFPTYINEVIIDHYGLRDIIDLHNYEKKDITNRLLSYYDKFNGTDFKKIILFLEDIEKLSNKERAKTLDMLSDYQRLNNRYGKTEAQKRIKELTLLPKYWNQAHDDEFIQHIESSKMETNAANENSDASLENHKHDNDIMHDNKWEND